MSDPKDGESFFRKVARFVTNPTTDWAEINSRQDDPESDLKKAEVRAMVERKRRNDFVRKRELDMLRRIRREGLTPEQLAALGSSSSRLDEVERTNSELNSNSKIDPRVKDKIDAIEQQMVGERNFPSTQVQGQHPPGFFETSTRPIHFAATTVEPTLPSQGQASAPPPPFAPQVSAREPAPAFAPPTPAALSPAYAPFANTPVGSAPPGRSDARVSQFSSREEMNRLEAMPPPAAVTMGAGMSPLSDAKSASLLPPSLTEDLPPLEMTFSPLPPAPTPAAASAAGSSPDLSLSFSVAEKHIASDLNELVHDPELDEAVIAFANADYETSERILTELTHKGGQRHTHGETWLVLFDHHRATGAQAKFEALALEYAQQFGLSAPQWFSMPKLVAEAAKSVRAPMGRSGSVGWTAPEFLQAESVRQLQARCENLPMPWVLDWAPLRQLDIEACDALRQLFRQWAEQQIDMRWLAGDRFLQLLKDQSPVAVRDVDPALWMLRLETLRLVNRPDQFDETAIDYCVTYEVSPPSWERSKCRVRVSGQGLSTSSSPPTSTLPAGEAPTTSFMESQISEQTQIPTTIQLELSGQLSGDISETLRLMTTEIGAAPIVDVACTKLIRLDFMAAGDLLNWVLARRGENRSVVFTEAHRLVALFFGAMGINEHARVKIRQV
ncbi:hypothetical protein SNE35_06255 [Paucibacter sp. R3-3]|uniref:STAS domain-containing protein n=1 Tax=Roseateles agri TaxID=3098619 RepID=A0ABU5DCU4_9BURK|nr:hypothetical protein [Paucibacter sp. R3-3]MDY0744097.1 hypothetical protein [Paucibacter sp. R3-3]